MSRSPSIDSLRLLIIDDEPALLDLLRRYLGRLGYEVETYDAPGKALERLQAEPESFSMIITDLSLPEMNGEELIRKLRVLRPRLPAIITSGYPYQPQAPDVGFLQKPFLPQALVEQIEKALKGQA
jgi:DNA-binding NtrC family response regulator